MQETNYTSHFWSYTVVLMTVAQCWRNYSHLYCSRSLNSIPNLSASSSIRWHFRLCSFPRDHVDFVKYSWQIADYRFPSTRVIFFLNWAETYWLGANFFLGLNANLVSMPSTKMLDPFSSGFVFDVIFPF